MKRLSLARYLRHLEPGLSAAAYEDAADFVCKEIEALPPPLRIAFSCLAVGLGGLSLIVSAAVFRRLRASGPSVVCDVLYFFESLSTFALLSKQTQ